MEKNDGNSTVSDERQKWRNGITCCFSILHPPLFFSAPLIGILQKFLYVGFLVKHFSLKEVIWNDTECAVFLQGAPTCPEYAGQFLIRQEAFPQNNGLSVT